MALTIQFKIPEATRALIRRLTPETFRTVQRETMRIWLLRFVRTLKELSPGTGSGRTGHYRGGWRTREVGGAGIAENPVNYADYVERDTVPHWIFPRAKPFLAWRPGKSAPSSANYKGGKPGEWVYSRREVYHPGTKGQHVFARAWEKDSPHLIETFGQEADRALTGGTGAAA